MQKAEPDSIIHATRMWRILMISQRLHLQFSLRSSIRFSSFDECQRLDCRRFLCVMYDEVTTFLFHVKRYPCLQVIELKNLSVFMALEQ